MIGINELLRRWPRILQAEIDWLPRPTLVTFARGPGMTLADVEGLLAELCSRMDLAPGDVSADGLVSVARNSCSGLCGQ